MNSTKIEMLSIDQLRLLIDKHPVMHPLINNNDKEPSWDGFIYTYKNPSLKVEEIEYRVPVQVKGKNDEKQLKKQTIQYPVEYKHLRNYFNGSGVFYFVIVISDDGEKFSVFYNALTPIKLQSYLSAATEKQPNQTKNITLFRLKKNDNKELYRLLCQFAHDSKEQGAGELVRNSINFEDMGRLNAIRSVSFTKDTREALSQINQGEICLFGRLGNENIWRPFSFDLQKRLELNSGVEIEKEIGLGNEVFYHSFKVESNGKKEKLRLSENLAIDVEAGKLDFRAIADLECTENDVKFIKAMRNEKSILMEGEPVVNYADFSLTDGLDEKLLNFEKAMEALRTIQFMPKKRIDAFDEENWRALDRLIYICSDKMQIAKESDWYMWWWDGKVIPLLLLQTDNRDIGRVCNILATKEMEVKIEQDGIHYRVPRFVHLKNDIWEKLYDIEEEILMDDLEACDFNKETESLVAMSFLEILTAYDTVGDEKYYNLAVYMADKLLTISPDCDDWKLNKLQLAKRKRELTEEELRELEEIEYHSDNQLILCAVNVLLGNKRKAENIFSQMEPEEQEIFQSYPIYQLCKR